MRDQDEVERRVGRLFDPDDLAYPVVVDDEVVVLESTHGTALVGDADFQSNRGNGCLELWLLLCVANAEGHKDPYDRRAFHLNTTFRTRSDSAPATAGVRIVHG